MKFTIEDTSAIALIVFSIVFLLIVYSGSALEKNGITVKLISNTDRCEDCKTVYNVCLDNILTSSKITDYKFLFSNELLKGQNTLSSLKSVPNITYKLDKTGLCYDVTIAAKKSPFANIDNILCFGSTCFNEFVWWNSTCNERWLIGSNSLVANFPFAINDTFEFFNTEIWTQNKSNMYVYNCSYGFVVANETDKLNYDIVNSSGINGNNPSSVYDSPYLEFHMNIINSVIVDVMGNKNMDMINTPHEVTGLFGNAIFFLANETEYLRNTTIDGTKFNSHNQTMIMFAKKHTSLSNYDRLYQVGGNSAGSIWGAGSNGVSTNNWSMGVWGGAEATDPQGIILNNWYCLAFTYNGSKGGVWVNGTLKATASITPSIPNPASFTIGASATGANPFNGTIDEFRVYDRVLTSDEINSFCMNGFNTLSNVGGIETYIVPFCNYTFNVVDNDTIVHLTNVTLIGDFGNFTNVNSPFNSNNITNGTHNFTVSAIGYYEINDSLTCNTVRPTTNMTIYLFSIPVIPPINISNVSGEICCPDWNLATKSICYDNSTLYQEYNEYHCLNGLCENATAFRYVNCPYGCVVQIDNMGDGCIVPNYQLDFMFIAIILGIIIIFAIIWKRK